MFIPKAGRSCKRAVDSTCRSGGIILTVRVYWFPNCSLGIEVRGDIIAMAVRPDELLIAGSDDHAALAEMAVRTRRCPFDHPRFISGIPLRLVDNHWETYYPRPTSAGYAELKDLSMETLAREYHAQMKALFQMENRAGGVRFLLDV